MSKTFYFIAGIALTGCLYFESSPIYSSEAVRAAETEVTQYEYPPDDDDYSILLEADSIKVYDGERQVFAEHYDSGSAFSRAILKDNE